jgi:prevent-host-death family protein
MRQVGAYEAKTRLSELLDEVESGDSITITRRGRPVAILTPSSPVASEPEHVIRELRSARRGVRLRGLTIRELIDEGRR